jgi:diguanylate cyclase (GGDEF)-like protein/putative nucleotidyltransferase with HDIG domain
VKFAPGLSRTGRTYLLTVVGLGFLVIAESVLQLYREPLGAQGLRQWVLLAVLTLISGSASVELPRANVSISISEAFVFTAVLLYGPAAGTLTVALDGLVISLWVARRRPELHRALFNISAPALSAWCSAQLFFLVSGIAPLSQQPATLNQILPALVLFAIVYFGLNSSLIASVIAFQKRLNPFEVWRGGFLWLSLNYFCGASLAVLLVGYNRSIDVRFVGVVVPLLLVLYFTFKTSMQRVEDANKHVDTLNALYLSTIETLAMAIDAKDQVTHGHIRRVQSYATALATKVGIRQERLLKAIEAAALLHDMGKLAVPEYILNKPGKLTEAEFEKMKLHASVGADILSAIAFPYPVVPIVRHHHENWDGSGYPSGLRGTDIPIGARILSVVDCFDALTSDRPYRPRLSDEEAVRILLARRGSMYDPLVVDTFVRVHQQIEPAAIAAGQPQEALNEIASARKLTSVPAPSPVLEEIAASADEMLTLYELAQGLAGQMSVSQAGDLIAKHLKRLVPSSLLVFYIHDRATSELEARHSVGDGAATVKGLRIPLGQRLSGWVAANRQTIANSDAILDLGDAARPHSLALKSCLSTPLQSNDQLIGVLSLYSSDVNGFTDDHRRVMEAVARQIASTFERAIEFDGSARRDELVGLPSLTQLEHHISGASRRVGTNVDRYSLLVIDVLRFNQASEGYSRATDDDDLRHVARHIRAELRAADILFRNPGNEFVAFLSGADSLTADAIAERIRVNFTSHSLSTNGSQLLLSLRVTTLCSPRDGRSPSELLSIARHQRAADPPAAKNGVIH